MELLSHISKSLGRTVQDPSNQKDDHNTRSRKFIGNLTDSLVEYFKRNEGNSIVGFSKGSPYNNEFGLNEFMFDIHICRYDFTESSIHAIKIPFIVEPILQLESEFAESNRESIKDFSKLVVGKAKYKIMILPNSMKNNEVDNYLKPQSPIAKYIHEELYAVFIPHPRNWGKFTEDVKNIKYYKFSNDNWEQC